MITNLILLFKFSLSNRGYYKYQIFYLNILCLIYPQNSQQFFRFQLHAHPFI